ncbi:MAG TPA: nucleoside triphosphate pyrophosphohydrolase family protein [Candidatus Paceibacterota bacterium]|nr:nucleoside triphosphate pyrophosphohydrolase family protein [Candidatus Paceibacterota bacterium]
MDFNTYQKKVQETAIYQNVGHNFVYPALGLAGETGEVVEKIKKLIRDNDTYDAAVVDVEKRAEIQKEMGDVLWYLAQLSTEFGMSFEDVAQMNIEKLASRKERGVLHGSGDNR